MSNPKVSLQITMIIEDEHVLKQCKSSIAEHFSDAFVLDISLKDALNSDEPLFLSCDLCFIHVPLFDRISSDDLTDLAAHVPVHVLGTSASKKVLKSISSGTVKGFSTLETLAVTVLTHQSVTFAGKQEEPLNMASTQFNQHFQGIADSMRSGVVRVLDKKNGDREVLFSNEGFYRLFEVSHEAVINDFTVVLDLIHPDDLVLNIRQIRNEVQKTGEAVNQYFRIITPTKKIKWIHLISNATETEDEEILHDFIVSDITEQKRKEHFFKEISKVSVNGGWDLDLISNTLFWTDETKKIHEVPPYFQPTEENVLIFYKDEDSRNRVIACFEDIKQSGKPFDERFEITTALGNNKWVRLRGEAESVEGDVVRVFGILQDITELVKKENELLESITEKSALLGEIHHRVKNNLAIISGLLQLELMKGANSRFSLEDAVNRIQSIATVHEILYSTDNFIDIDIEKYIKKLVANISSTYPKLVDAVDIRCNIDQINLTINQAVPLGLLQNELITNSVKHAFSHSESGTIDIEIHRIDSSTMAMNYRDSGKGFNKKKLESSESLGFTLIQSLLQQLDATVSIETEHGFHLSCTFALEEIDHSKVFS